MKGLMIALKDARPGATINVQCTLNFSDHGRPDHAFLEKRQHPL